MLSECALRPVVLGICGAQGSGKSTVASALADRLEQAGVACAVLSLDDLYLPKPAREELAREVHPLLATRGPPGTHDIALGIEVLDALRAAEPTALPRFDKARDDQADPASWSRVEGQCQVLLFEGWCVGAVPQDEAELARPVNDLEAREDADGVWRRFVNTALAGSYQALFARIDRLVLLAAPGFDVVFDWRVQQEDELRAARPDGTGIMSRAEVARFVQHYERITRHVLAEMPSRADLLVRLDRQRKPVTIGGHA
ncbi:MAG: kinase [Novosphingobium sp.]|nr:kinase [Novosphingobium sp.]